MQHLKAELKSAERRVRRAAGSRPSEARGRADPGQLPGSESGLPFLLTADEVADLLRTSRGVIYGMASMEQLPGIMRIGRRLLFRRDRMLEWLRESSATPL